MKATGIVRRIDELGRLVIPKEIRRSLRIRESDPIEIYTDRDGEIILRKYARMRELNDFAAVMAQALNGAFGVSAAITDTETVLAASGLKKKQLLGAALNDGFIAAIHKRQSLFYDNNASARSLVLKDQTEPFLQLCMVPITASGDPVGSVMLLTDEHRDRFALPELQTLKAVALYLGKLLEE